MKMQTKNKIKYSSSLILSMIGSEAFKLGTAIYIYKFTNSFWLVSILYLLIQIPTFISYLLNYKIIKKRNLKHILLWTDIISFSILATILIGYFVIIKSNNLFGFSIFLLVINSLLSIVHSFRFIALKTIIYNISNNEKDVKTYNVLTTISTSIAFLLAPIFSLILFSKLPFWTLILLNMVTYLISGFLYFSFKLNEKEIELVKQEKTDLTNQSNIKQNNALKWVYTLSSSFIIGIFLYPKQSGMSQFFKVIDFDANKWSFFLTIIFALFGLAGSLLSLIIRNKNIKLLWVLIPMNLIFLITIPILFSNVNNKFKNIAYLITIGFQQMLYSFFITIFYTNSYFLFDKEKFKNNTIYTLIFRIISSSIIIILLTFVSIKLNYFITFTIFATLIFISSVLITISENIIMKIKTKDKLTDNTNEVEKEQVE
ncbi:hypothetical protein PR253_03195 [Metamycoplasma hyosynoviae]|uniref:hypothetical protein n=7 Tax=Metamycoplasma hyosynoviae TaxID=29559 RepID=UPI00235836D2|nr:hypothetical protein [Metamycoplasma hyosynoviae]MDC8920677.1 hypothetical protein [Metamycoplasma hyosynoviae]